MAKLEKGEKAPSSFLRIINRLMNLYESKPLKIEKRDGKISLSGMMR